MNILFRILLAIYGFCMAVVSFITASIALNPQVYERIADYMDYNILPSNRARVCMFIIALIFFILSLVFLLSGIKSNKDKKSVSKYTNIGEIKISLNSIESIALAAARRLNGIKDTKATILKMPDGVSITIRAVIMGDVNVPALSEDMQVKVKSSVEEATGIKVNNVLVTVDNIYTGYKSRVE